MARKAKTVAVEEPVDFGQMIAAVPIEVWPIEDVLFDPSNANTHDRASIDAIRGSIAKFGQVEPLLIRKSTAVLIAGEGRLVAMKELGFTHVEVRPLDVDATTAAMLSLALNRTAELSHFNFESVAAQLKGFRADGHEVEVLGWTGVELAKLMGEAPKVEEANDPDEEWQGMPEFEHEDLKPHRTIHVHFASDADVDAFAKLIGQEIHKSAKWIWHPYQKNRTYSDKVWESNGA